jgi:hypothetical protein
MLRVASHWKATIMSTTSKSFKKLNLLHSQEPTQNL